MELVMNEDGVLDMAPETIEVEKETFEHMKAFIEAHKEEFSDFMKNRG